MEPGSVGPSSPRATTASQSGPATASRKSPAIWIAIAIATMGFVVIAAATSRGRNAAQPVAIAPEVIAPAIVSPDVAVAQPALPVAVMHPPAALPPAGTLADASRGVSIEMYSAAWCSACGRAKTWMQTQGIAFHEVDVDRRAGAMAQLQMLNPRSSLPTFDVDGQVVVGFQEARLRTAIDDAARRVQAPR